MCIRDLKVYSQEINGDISFYRDENNFEVDAILRTQSGKWGAIDENGNIVVEPSLTLDNNTVINFIGTWHLSEDTNARYYTK